MNEPTPHVRTGRDVVLYLKVGFAIVELPGVVRAMQRVMRSAVRAMVPAFNRYRQLIKDAERIPR